MKGIIEQIEEKKEYSTYSYLTKEKLADIFSDVFYGEQPTTYGEGDTDVSNHNFVIYTGVRGNKEIRYMFRRDFVLEHKVNKNIFNNKISRKVLGKIYSPFLNEGTLITPKIKKHKSAKPKRRLYASWKKKKKYKKEIQ